MLDLGSFELEFENGIVTFKISTLEFGQLQNFAKKQKCLNLGPKNYCHFSNQHPYIQVGHLLLRRTFSEVFLRFRLNSSMRYFFMYLCGSTFVVLCGCLP